MESLDSGVYDSSFYKGFEGVATPEQVDMFTHLGVFKPSGHKLRIVGVEYLGSELMGGNYWHQRHLDAALLYRKPKRLGRWSLITFYRLVALLWTAQDLGHIKEQHGAAIAFLRREAELKAYEECLEYADLLSSG